MLLKPVVQISSVSNSSHSPLSWLEPRSIIFDLLSVDISTPDNVTIATSSTIQAANRGQDDDKLPVA
jgi:hypothetical protein